MKQLSFLLGWFNYKNDKSGELYRYKNTYSPNVFRVSSNGKYAIFNGDGDRGDGQGGWWLMLFDIEKFNKESSISKDLKKLSLS